MNIKLKSILYDYYNIYKNVVSFPFTSGELKQLECNNPTICDCCCAIDADNLKLILDLICNKSAKDIKNYKDIEDYTCCGKKIPRDKIIRRSENYSFYPLNNEERTLWQFALISLFTIDYYQNCDLYKSFINLLNLGISKNYFDKNDKKALDFIDKFDKDCCINKVNTELGTMIYHT